MLSNTSPCKTMPCKIIVAILSLLCFPLKQPWQYAPEPCYSNALPIFIPTRIRCIEPVGWESLGRDGNTVWSSRSNVLGLIRQPIVTSVHVILVQLEPALETA